MPYDYASLAAQNDAVTGSNLAGAVPPDVIYQLQQQAAERGVSTGMGPGAPATNAAYLRALGLTSLDLQQRGQTAFAATRDAQLQQQALQEKAAEFAANMSFEEKQLAQQLGISEEQFALEKAKQEIQQQQFQQSQAQQAQQFGVEAGQSQQKINIGQQEFGQTFGLQQKELAQKGSQFGQTLALDYTQLAQQGALEREKIAASKISPAPWWTAAGVYNPANTSTVYRNNAGQIVGPNGY